MHSKRISSFTLVFHGAEIFGIRNHVSERQKLLLLEWNGLYGIESLFYSGYFYRIPSAFPENFLIYTTAYSLLLECIFLYKDNRCNLRIHKQLLLIHSTFTFLFFDKNRDQCFPGMTSVCVSFFIISHVFTFADILFEIPFLPFFISLWFYVRLLFCASQISIRFFTFISRISCYTQITQAQLPFHCL